MSELAVRHIVIDNVRGISHAELNFGPPRPNQGKLIVLCGDNAVGKTSVLAGIAAVFVGGHDASLIRDGEEKAAALMTLSNGTTIHRSITQKGSYIKITTEDGTPVKAPESYLKSLASGFGFDPIAFDQADKKKRLEFLLRVCPIAFDADEITVAMMHVSAVVPPPPGVLDITAVGKLIRDLTEKRGIVGTRRDDRAASVETFRKALLAADSGDTPVDWTAEVARLTKERDSLDSSERTDIEGIQQSLDETLRGLAISHRGLEDAITQEFNTLLVHARSGADQTLSAEKVQAHLNSLRESVIYENDINKLAADAKTRIYNENVATRQQIAIDLEKASAGHDAQIKTQGIRESMEGMREEAKALSQQWDYLAGAIKNLEALKRSKLEDLPVAGLEVSADGDILIEGRPWDNVNQAARWLKSIEIGCQGLGELGTIITDEAEHLGPTNWAAFEDAVVSSGITVVAARVSSKEEIAKFGPGLRSEPAGALKLA